MARVANRGPFARLAGAGSVWAGGLLAIVLSLAGASKEASAEHFDLGSFVPSLTRCDPADADTATATGVPACSLVKFTSDCDGHPDTALKLGPKSKATYRVRPSGRKLTRKLGRIDLRSVFKTKDLQTCQGVPYTGQLGALTDFRMTLNDPACAGGLCSVPEVSVEYTLECKKGKCKGAQDANDILTAGGAPALPTELPWTGVASTFDVLDLAGNRLLTPGLLLARDKNAPRPGFPKIASKWESRVVPPYEPCPAAGADTTTTQGRAACSTPVRLSDCGSDPDNAVLTDPGPGFRKLRYLKSRKGLMAVGRFVGLLSCSGRPYSGPLTLQTLYRATFKDAACAGGMCTAVDQVVSSAVVAEDGRAKFKEPFVTLADGVEWVSVEIIDASITDASGNAMLAGHGFLVRCNSGGDGLCFGN